ncbi:MAG: DUF6783 domain-containing protein [Ruminococcus sp.]
MGDFARIGGAVVSYGSRIRVKSLRKVGVQISGMIFQTTALA